MRASKIVKISNAVIGGGNPVLIQSMTNTDTADTSATVRQILALEQAGCEIVRVAAYDIDSAKNIKNIKEKIHIPIVADVHFDYKIAVAAMEAGADKVRINPGNIGSIDKIKCVVDAAKCAKIPLRVGANTGSIRKDLRGEARTDALVKSAMDNIRTLEECGFYDIVVSLKSSSVVETVEASKKISKLCDYPLHLGVTEAGGYNTSVIKSSIGIGALLLDGIGDTIRVSVTGDPVQEIGIAKGILSVLGLRQFGADIISCPTCARTHFNMESLINEVEKLTANWNKHIKIAVMGCEVNGPGEAADADIGIAGGKDCALIFAEGKPVKKVSKENMIEEFKRELEKLK